MPPSYTLQHSSTAGLTCWLKGLRLWLRRGLDPRGPKTQAQNKPVIMTFVGCVIHYEWLLTFHRRKRSDMYCQAFARKHPSKMQWALWLILHSRKTKVQNQGYCQLRLDKSQSKSLQGSTAFFNACLQSIIFSAWRSSKSADHLGCPKWSTSQDQHNQCLRPWDQHNFLLHDWWKFSFKLVPNTI